MRLPTLALFVVAPTTVIMCTLGIYFLESLPKSRSIDAQVSSADDADYSDVRYYETAVPVLSKTERTLAWVHQFIPGSAPGSASENSNRKEDHPASEKSIHGRTTPQPTASSTPEPTLTPNPTPTPTPTTLPATPVPTIEPVPSTTPTPISTPVPTLAPAPTPSPTPAPTATPTPAPTILPSPTPTPTPIPTIMPTPTPTLTLAPTPTPTPLTTPTPTPTISPTPAPIETNPWEIRSVSSMKESKDRICSQRSPEYIAQWVAKAKGLGANYIAVETPYDDPSCDSSLQYTKVWVDAIHGAGLKVWHRHMPLAFEGIYSTPKDNSTSYLQQIASYIINNPTYFQEGDIFTPIPEPQNGGITGSTYCPENVCQFAGIKEFNQWLRDAINVSDSAFAHLELQGKVKIGYYGFDGFVAWGHNNPDWNGLLEDETIRVMGNITIDHYPEIVSDTMENSLNELEQRYPGVPIVIGEWGTISSGDPVIQVEQARAALQAARRPSVIGVNYWHMGSGGFEALIQEDFSEYPHYSTVQQFFTATQ